VLVPARLTMHAGVAQRGAGTRRRVLIVDDHPIVRQGLRRMIDPEPDLAVCGEAQTDREARAAIRELDPDVVIVDISLNQGDGLELVRDVHAQRPSLPMLVLSMHEEAIYAERVLAAGASGYIMKHAARISCSRPCGVCWPGSAT
jgi:DNA-binding NarL/FixJ family response regulator